MTHRPNKNERDKWAENQGRIAAEIRQEDTQRSTGQGLAAPLRALLDYRRERKTTASHTRNKEQRQATNESKGKDKD